MNDLFILIILTIVIIVSTGREFTKQELSVGLALVGIPLLLFANATSTVFWLIGAASTLCLAHAATLPVDPTAAAMDEIAS